MAAVEEVEQAGGRPIYWLGGARHGLRSFPDEVRREIGFALWFAQRGEKHPSAKPLKGFKGAGVLEIVEDYRGDTFRAVYTVRFIKAVYVLHAFQKKSKSGVKTPKHEVELIERRLKLAQEVHKQLLKETKNESPTKDPSRS
ncbi:MAG TPA: type II toxin-antitoxin system RelE/ParE family toxin [Tepidisphaeraceae bacterium]|jgi:phage-related protein|nr:type II toxin-antitoxin system RelE/ParE family toxin [Tepidisphaeraceae bacterium]